jgi:dGTPase
MTDALDWNRLLGTGRRSLRARGADPEPRQGQDRAEHERDYDRVLYATPTRRMQDKTQVFPLDRNDGVRTRLTHSHEVASMARSFGVSLAFDHAEAVGLPAGSATLRSVPALLAGLGLAHDIGNPPFGHQGEGAIRSWVARHARPRAEDPASHGLFDADGMGPAHRRDFLAFEGNAQGFRLLTRLQTVDGGFGLDLTDAFLAGVMKYPNLSDAGTGKFNVLQSERAVAEEVWEATGLGPGRRHPLALAMEACDDIAYCVVDLEDAARKGLINFNVLVAFLRHEAGGDPEAAAFLDWVEAGHAEVRGRGLSPREIDDLSMQRFRYKAIGRMVSAAIDAFVARWPEIAAGGLSGELLASSRAAPLWRALKRFAREHVYTHRTVLEVELQGHAVIHGLMDILWSAVTDRADPHRLRSARPPLANYVYSRISENYRRVAETADPALPVRYRDIQLVTDMVSGMSDGFAVDLHADLRRRGA